MTAAILNGIWIFLQILIGYNLVLPLVLFLLYIIFRGRNKSVTAGKEYDYAIIVTAYEQTDFLPMVVESIQKLKYSNYIIYIVADKCDISNLKFADERVVVLRPPETLGSNTRSHFYAIRNFRREHELLTIIDSDNLVDPDYLNELNKCFDKGYSAVQGIRKAKNLDTMYACLDAARDMYYHFYDGEVLFRLGSSATLAGSGMAFKVSLYRECLERLDIVGAGFDKVLQYEIVRRAYRIAFTDKAIVYDEKTGASDQLVKQRARWINTWFRYFKFGFSLVFKGIITFNWNRLLFGIVLLRPPLFIFLILSVMFAAANLFISIPAMVLWLAGFACFVAGFIIALVEAKPERVIWQSLWGIPKFIFYQVLSLLRVRKANKISVATKHNYSKQDKNG
ncbi:MAG: glycosyltransferase family 2 protein [Flavipsychrobacter sp.]|jgi:cellulose synthase/poly-beta-1,6-N-acetylglucosamine synthase-like glycosyltransferase|nr:glycosyltransferase family 2 protein [Flavipsychrobacter sp.]